MKQEAVSSRLKQSATRRETKHPTRALSGVVRKLLGLGGDGDMDAGTKSAILAVKLRVAKANGSLDLDQIDRLYTEFTEGNLNQPALRFGIQLYLGDPGFSRDPLPYNDVTAPGDGKVVVAAGLAVGFEQGRFSDEAIQCIATAAHACGVDATEIAAARDLLDMSEYDDETSEEGPEPPAISHFSSTRTRRSSHALKRAV